MLEHMQWVEVIGRPDTDAKVLRFLGLLGATPSKTDDGETFHRASRYGVEVLCRDGRLAEIACYGRGWEGFQGGYEGDLPLGASFGETLEDTRERLGEPAESGASNGRTYLRYDLTGGVVQLQFDGSSERLNRVSVMSPRYGEHLSADSFWKAVLDMEPDFTVEGPRQRAPDDAALDDVAERLGVQLPTSYRDIVKRHSALTVEADGALWPEPKRGEAGAAWKHVRGFEVYSPGDDLPDELNVERVTEQFRDDTGSDWTPFAALRGSADFFCFTPDGSIVRWVHGHDPDAQETTPLASNVYRLLLPEIRQLMRNMRRIRRAG